LGDVSFGNCIIAESPLDRYTPLKSKNKLPKYLVTTKESFPSFGILVELPELLGALSGFGILLSLSETNPSSIFTSFFFLSDLTTIFILLFVSLSSSFSFSGFVADPYRN
jgi:hypothetical protein